MFFDPKSVFFIFTSLAILSGAMVIRTSNPVYSVLYLICVFFCTAALLVLHSLDFFAMIFLVVYVGAIAVLFLFVVMMLDIKIEEKQDSLLSYVPVGAFIGFIFFLEVLGGIDVDFLPFNPSVGSVEDLPLYTVWTSGWKKSLTIASLGQVLYTHYYFFFFVAGLILLVAMIGAILLTLDQDSKDPKRQEIYDQNARDSLRTIRKFGVPKGLRAFSSSTKSDFKS